MKFFIVELSPLTIFIPFGPKYSPQVPISVIALHGKTLFKFCGPFFFLVFVQTLSIEKNDRLDSLSGVYFYRLVSLAGTLSGENGRVLILRGLSLLVSCNYNHKPLQNESPEHVPYCRYLITFISYKCLFF